MVAAVMVSTLAGVCNGVRLRRLPLVFGTVRLSVEGGAVAGAELEGVVAAKFGAALPATTALGCDRAADVDGFGFAGRSLGASTLTGGRG
jgi:hypothetical protein